MLYKKTTVTNNSFIAKLMATHPAPMERIDALEDENIAKKKIGKLFVATPFAINNNSVGGNSEIIRLTVILLIIGYVASMISCSSVIISAFIFHNSIKKKSESIVK